MTLNLVVYGLTAPFAAALMERFGIRRVVAISLALVGTASALTTFMTAAWQLWLLWGVAIGAGTGSMALVFGAIVANRGSRPSADWSPGSSRRPTRRVSWCSCR